jgi:hypothetical protein
MADSKVVCFSETPLEHAYSVVQDIAGRQVHLSSFVGGRTEARAG